MPRRLLQPRELDRLLFIMIVVLASAAMVVMGVLLLHDNRRISQQAHNNRTLVTCLDDWANRTTTRAALLTRLNADKSNALDQIIRAVASPTPRKSFHLALKRYLRASDAYNAAVKNHPLPKSPKLACDG